MNMDLIIRLIKLNKCNNNTKINELNNILP